MTPRLLIATGNRHKVLEISRILETWLAPGSFEALSSADFPQIEPPEEDGATFEANALIKARAYARQAGLLTLADDSGLVVDALGGRPGVLSARYAETSELRNARVLAELHGVPPERRTARFECVMALVDTAGLEVTRRGTLEGRIAPAPRGEGGFGYDPIFELMDGPHAGRVVAELPGAEKDAISHRGRALAAIAPLIAEALAPKP